MNPDANKQHLYWNLLLRGDSTCQSCFDTVVSEKVQLFDYHLKISSKANVR